MPADKASAGEAAALALGSPTRRQHQHHDSQQQHQQPQQQDEQQQPQGEEGVTDEVLLYGELMTALRRGGGSLRAEAILEQLLQELGAARAALSSERGEGRAVRARLEVLEEEHTGCKDSRKGLQVSGVASFFVERNMW
jgi:hypothetical protein